MLPTKFLVDMPDGTPKEDLTRSVTFRMKPSDVDELKRVSSLYGMEFSRMARRLVLAGLREAKRHLRTK